eukprot:GILI01006958.1.p1 GENE.GILI01006958.1~~GILI01006958.1.p1  ORF type:complete len:680 (-),score=52.59 GILI01006958.1:80-2119(-)
MPAPPTNVLHSMCDRKGALFICPICRDAGVDYTATNSSNMSAHLRSKAMHNLKEPLESNEVVLKFIRVREERIKRAAETMKGPMDAHVKKNPFTDEEYEVIRWCDHFDSLERVESASELNCKNRIVKSSEMRKKAIQLSKTLLDKRLVSLANSCVTLAIDSGTIFKRYLGILICVPKEPPILYDLIEDDEFIDGQQTSNNLNLVLTRVVVELAAKKITVLAVVADNAANMQAENTTPPGVLKIRCFAHSIQLAARYQMTHDTRIGRMLQVVRDRKAKNPDCPIPDEVPTRWNTTYDMLVKTQDRNISVLFQATEEGRIKEIVSKLDHFAKATDSFQSDNCTLFGALCILTQIAKSASQEPYVLEALSHHLKHFMSQAVILLLYLCPNFKIEDFPDAYKSQALAILSSCSKVVENQIGAESDSDCITKEKRNWQSARYDPEEMTVVDSEFMTYQKFTAWWTEMKKDFPRLSWLAMTVAKLTPTEGSCERFFSAIKRCVHPTRSSMAKDLILAQTQVAAMWKEVVDLDAVHSSEAVPFCASGARTLLRFATTPYLAIPHQQLQIRAPEATAQASQRPPTKPERQRSPAPEELTSYDDDQSNDEPPRIPDYHAAPIPALRPLGEHLCSKCYQYESYHPDNTLFLDCANCHLWFASTCLQSRFSRNMRRWTCGVCRDVPSDKW